MDLETILFVFKLTYWIIRIYNVVSKTKGNKTEN